MKPQVQVLEPTLMNPVIALRIATLFGLVATVLGTLGAHWLNLWLAQGQITQVAFEDFRFAVYCQFFHALAILAVGCAGPIFWLQRTARWAVFAWTAGILVYCGSLYLNLFLNTQVLIACAPFGSVALVLGWFLAFLAVRHRVHPSHQTELQH